MWVARNMWKRIVDHENVDKVAHFGFHPVARILASFVISFTSHNKLKFFTSKEDAMAWVRE